MFSAGVGADTSAARWPPAETAPLTAVSPRNVLVVDTDTVAGPVANWRRRSVLGALGPSGSLPSRGESRSLSGAPEVLLSDGPFAETKEQILGFDVIDAADLDEAIEVTSQHPATRLGLVEIRPLVEG
jgi:hypothetical protein